jgi:hypothetical protein
MFFFAESSEQKFENFLFMDLRLFTRTHHQFAMFDAF